MKTALQLLLFALCVNFSLYAQESQKNFINYQGVANDASGEAIVNTSIDIQIALRFGSATAGTRYVETHTLTTDATGVFSLQIGNGTIVSGTYNPSDFGVLASYITVSLNGTEVGTTEMVAVPYAISSGDKQWVLNGTDIENINTGTVKVTDMEIVGTIFTQAGTSINEFSTDGTFSDNSDAALPTERAVKTYVDTNAGAAQIDDLSDAKSGIVTSPIPGSDLYLGKDAGANDNSPTNQNLGVGIESLHLNTSGSNNTALGNEALYSNISGNVNTAVGFSALRANTEGISNVAVGGYALLTNTTGRFNTGLGTSTLRNNSTGESNTANGAFALENNTIGNRNTATGFDALSNNTTGNNNTANGLGALNMNTRGFNNTAIGFNALSSNSVGENNTAIGVLALESNLTGSENTAIGRNALENNTNGHWNVAVGSNALRSLLAGNNNIGIGRNANVPSARASNQVRIGNTGITYAGIQVAWTVTSDKRWKNQIRNLPFGLNMLSQLRPVDYIRKNNEKQTREIGFIAQEVEQVLATLGYKEQGFLTQDDKGYLSIRYNDLIPVLTKAIQEQQAQIEALKNTNNKQDSALAQVLKRVASLESLTQSNSENRNDLVYNKK